MSRELPLVRVRVARGTQLSFDGTTYVSGSEVQAPEDIAERWITRGWAESSDSTPADTAASKSPSRSRRTR